MPNPFDAVMFDLPVIFIVSWINNFYMAHKNHMVLVVSYYK